MDIKERQRLLKEKRDQEAAARAIMPPEQAAVEEEKLKEKIKQGKMRYNRGTGKLEPID